MGKSCVANHSFRRALYDLALADESDTLPNSSIAHL
jgi:hypothetical protein